MKSSSAGGVLKGEVQTSPYLSPFLPALLTSPHATDSCRGADLPPEDVGGSDADYALSVAVDVSGRIYTTGYTRSFGPGFPLTALTLHKYDSTGSLLWQRIWSGSSGGAGFGVAVDAYGDIYVSGVNSSQPSYTDVLLLKFDSSGSLLWQKTWGGSNHDNGKGVAVDSSGNIYVVGGTLSFGAGGFDVLLLKFDFSGSLLWQKTWGDRSDDAVGRVAVDASGNIYMTGSTESFGAGSSDALLLRFNSTGSLLWQKTWGGSSMDAGHGLDIDTSGDVAVTGFVSEAPPYTLDSGNDTLGTPAFILAGPTGTLGDPASAPLTPTGTVQTSSGSQSYAGLTDEFLFEYGLLPTGTFPLILGGILSAVLMTTVAIALAKRRRR